VRDAFEAEPTSGAQEYDDAQRKLDDAFSRFEATQPALSARLEDALEKRGLDETARTLGYFLGVCVWLAFDRQFGGRLGRVDDIAVRAETAALDLESELRAAGDALDAEDVVTREQPALMEFIHEHIDVALENESFATKGDVDQPVRPAPAVDDVHAIYRVVLVELLSLSHAVAPHPGAPARRGEGTCVTEETKSEESKSEESKTEESKTETKVDETKADDEPKVAAKPATKPLAKSKPTTTTSSRASSWRPSWYRVGMGDLFIGIALLVAGTVVAMRTPTRWYGAFIVGTIETVHGLYLLSKKKQS